MKEKFKIFLSKTGAFFKKFGKRFAEFFFANKKSIAGFIIIMFFIFVGIFGPKIFPYNAEVDFNNRLAPMSWKHPFGTDGYGRDIFRQLISGTGAILTIAFYTAIVSVVTGTVLGLISGFVGGWVDKVIQLFTNIVLTIPSLPVFLILAALFTINDPFSFALILSIFGWGGLCRAIRAQVISLKERDFIQICNVMNMSKFHIIFKEVMPNIYSYIIINFILAIKNAITSSVGIMLIGIAAFEPTNWGAILYSAKDYGALFIDGAAIWLFSPIICICLLQLGAILLSNGLDETLNPRLRRN